MATLVTELIVTADMMAKGRSSPPFYGYDGPEFMHWLAGKEREPHRNLIGRRTYETLSSLPDGATGDDYRTMANNPGWVVSTSLAETDWPGLDIVRDDLPGHVERWKADGGDEIRTIGSLSVVRQLVAAKLVDRLRLIVCPLVLPDTGAEPVFEGHTDMAFELLDTKVLDGAVTVIDYRPNGAPPHASE